MSRLEDSQEVLKDNCAFFFFFILTHKRQHQGELSPGIGPKLEKLLLDLFLIQPGSASCCFPASCADHLPSCVISHQPPWVSHPTTSSL